MTPKLFRVTSSDKRGTPKIWFVKLVDSKFSDDEIIERALAGEDVKNLFARMEVPEAELEDKKFTFWPAVIGGRMPTDGMRFIVHEDVVRALKKHPEFSGQFFPFKLKNLPKKKIDDREPNYFGMLPDATIPIRIHTIGEVDKFNTADYRQLTTEEPVELPPLLAKTTPKGGLILCSINFIELARKNRWRNFEFQPYDAISGRALFRLESKKVDYLGNPFPPDEWYPPHQDEVIRKFELEEIDCIEWSRVRSGNSVCVAKMAPC
jgi:hypothetical protein